MAAKSKKMGVDPFSGRTGLNGLIQSTAPVALNTHKTQNTYNMPNPPDTQNIHNTHNTHETPETRPAKAAAGKPDRLNLALKPGSLEYLQTMSGFDTVSVTQYLNRLIEEDRQKRINVYENLKALRGEH